MRTTLFHGGCVRTGRGEERAEWLLVTDEAITAAGRGEPPPAGARVDLDGGTLVPGFADAHVHLPATGLYASGLDLRGERSARAIVAALARRARAEPDGILFGGNFEDPLDEPLTARDLDAAVGDRPALLGRADMHSCIVSTALVDELELGGVVGVDRDPAGRPTGYLREQAAAQAWSWFDRALTPAQQRDAVAQAVRVAYSKGVTEVHEMFVVEWRGWDSAEVFQAAVEDVALRVVTFLATDDVERVTAMGFDRIGGDYFLDGSFGSHTAWMRAPYLDTPPPGSPPNGISYRDDEELLDFFLRAQRARLQVGVHAIGDAAIDQALATWEAVSERVGRAQVAAAGHRIEHFECATDDHIRRAARLGLRPSIQPAFDRLWGGERGLYARRLGWDRARTMNRFGSMLRAGLTLAAGSDSTVTPLDPFLQMAALRAHHLAEESLPAADALALHTAGPVAVTGDPTAKGTLAAGRRADLALLDRDPLAVDPDELEKTDVLGTWIGGTRVWPPPEAEAA
ncbi:MAG TPA: amidohydrolase family protein [Actinomycetota bacterium]|nr:amidohydrolase family protein [Actinomycetota bacterium]